MYAIHSLSTADFPTVSRLFVENFPTIDDNDFAAAWSSIDLCSSMGLYYNATLVGFGLVSGSAAIKAVAFLTIHLAHRGGGNGTRLLQAIQNTCDSLTLKPVNCTTIISWYKRHGFVISQYMPFIHEDIPTCEMIWMCPTSPNSSRSTTRTSSVTSDEGAFSDGCISDSEIMLTPAAEILSAVGRLRRTPHG